MVAGNTRPPPIGARSKTSFDAAGVETALSSGAMVRIAGIGACRGSNLPHSPQPEPGLVPGFFRARPGARTRARARERLRSGPPFSRHCDGRSILGSASARLRQHRDMGCHCALHTALVWIRLAVMGASPVTGKAPSLFEAFTTVSGISGRALLDPASVLPVSYLCHPNNPIKTKGVLQSPSIDSFPARASREVIESMTFLPFPRAGNHHM